MAVTRLDVFMDGIRAGHLDRNSSGRVDFLYDHDYLNDPRSTPLSLSVPKSDQPSRPKAINAFLAGLLPDNDATLKTWARKYQVSAASPFSLLAHVGMDTAGALQIVPEGADPSDSHGRDGDIEWLSEDDMASLVRGLADHQSDWDSTRHRGRWSLAGAQSKLALFSDGTRWGIPNDSTPTTRILKPSIDGYDGHDVNEYMSMEAASRLGLAAAKSDLMSFGGEQVFVSHRYDRLQDMDGRWMRLHQEDFCQAMAVHPSKKYQNEGGPGTSQIADLLNRLPASRATDAKQRFFDYMAYNVAIGATDAHAKNFSLVHSGSESVLAPLYDVASVTSYHQDAANASAMRVGAHIRLSEINEADFVSLGRRLNISPDEAAGRYADIKSRIPDVFQEIAQEIEQTGRNVDMARHIADAVSAHASNKRDRFGVLILPEPIERPIGSVGQDVTSDDLTKSNDVPVRSHDNAGNDVRAHSRKKPKRDGA